MTPRDTQRFFDRLLSQHYRAMPGTYALLAGIYYERAAAARTARTARLLRARGDRLGIEAALEAYHARG